MNKAHFTIVGAFATFAVVAGVVRGTLERDYVPRWRFDELAGAYEKMADQSAKQAAKINAITAERDLLNVWNENAGKHIDQLWSLRHAMYELLEVPEPYMPGCIDDLDDDELRNAAYRAVRDLKVEREENEILSSANRRLRAERGQRLTVEQVRETIERNARSTVGRHVFSDAQYGAITDELNAALGSGECKVVASSTDGLTTDEPKKWFELSCGHSFMLYRLGVPICCPVCGRIVKR